VECSKHCLRFRGNESAGIKNDDFTASGKGFLSVNE